LNSISTGIFGGGSTLSSLAFRQILDCYAGTTVFNDGHTFSTGFTTATPSPNLLPTTCTSFSTAVEGLFAAVGSGNGQRAYIADDPRQLFRGSPKFAPARVKRPSANPPFIDAANPNFGTYPYPELDFTVSEGPLAGVVSSLTTVSFGSFTPSTNWQTRPSILAQTSTIASFNTAAVGAPIQVPAFEVPVAIAVDTANPVNGATFNIQSALTPNTQAGGAIQLSAAQLCAIFSATVTDWADTTTLIPFLDQNGVQQFQHFFDDNTNGTLTPVAYTNRHLAIKVVFRSDDSGTSFILTNYLANFCPLLDPTGTFNYTAIFTGVGITQGGTVTTTPNLPSSSFETLVDNIQAVARATDHDHHDPYDVDDDEDRPEPRWISAESSSQEALKIGTDAFHAGRLGYLSADFTQPYATSVNEDVDGDGFAAPAPLSASLQNQNQRVAGVYHPGMLGQNFIPPTPAGAENAFRSLTFPKPTATYGSWNIYSQVFSSGAVFGGVSYAGLSVIGDPQRVGAYPLTGATFLDLYSCYSDPNGTRVPALKNTLAWLFGGSTSSLAPYNPATSNFITPGFDPDVSAVIRNNGFHEIDTSWALEIERVYLKPSAHGGTPFAIAAFSTSGTQVDGCTGVTGGAQ
jgi:ABC-type phosphate transport system substrate-binding protein